MIAASALLQPAAGQEKGGDPPQSCLAWPTCLRALQVEGCTCEIPPEAICPPLAITHHPTRDEPVPGPVHLCPPIPVKPLAPSEQDSNNGGSDQGNGSSDSDNGTQAAAVTKKPRVAGTRHIAISAADRAAHDFIPNHLVPLIVERTYSEVFGQKITHQQSLYWKGRARSDKATESNLRDTMLWHLLHKVSK